ncbi:MAG: CHAT domain-containing tetratricopeptide repeat protein [Bacteroidota bacterium]
MINTRTYLFISFYFLCAALPAQSPPEKTAWGYFLEGEQLSSEMDYSIRVSEAYLTAADLYEAQEKWDSCILSIGRLFRKSMDEVNPEQLSTQLTRVQNLAKTHLPNSHPVWIEVHALEAQFYILQFDLPNIKLTAQQVLRLSQSEYGATHPMTFRAHRLMGKYHGLSGQDDSAYFFYRAAFDMIGESRIDSLEQVLVMLDLSVHSKYVEEEESGLTYLFQALDILNQLLPSNSYHPVLGSLNRGLGREYGYLGDRTLSLKYLKKALSIFQQIYPAVHGKIAELYQQLGLSYASLGESEQAIIYGRRGLEMNIQLVGPNHPSLIADYFRLGYIYEHKGDFEQAIQMFEKTVEFEKKQQKNGSRNLPIVYSLLGGCYAAIGEDDKAISIHEEAIRLTENSPLKQTQHYGLILDHFAETLIVVGDAERAREINFKALELNRVHFAEDKFKLTHNMQIWSRAEQALGNDSISLSLLEQTMTDFISNFSSLASPIFQYEIPLGGEAQVLSILNVAANNYLHWYQQDTTAIRRLYQAKTVIFQNLRLADSFQISRMDPGSDIQFLAQMKSYSNTAHDILYQLYRLTDSSQYLQQAFEVSERMKGNILRQAFLKGRTLASNPMPEARIQEQQSLLDSLNAIQKKLDRSEPNTDTWYQLRQMFFDTKLVYQRLLDKQKQDFPIYYNLIKNFDCPSLQYTQEKLLNDSQALVEYFLGEEYLYILLITPQKTSYLRKKTSPDLLEQLADFREKITTTYLLAPDSSSQSSPQASLVSHAKQMYQELFDPIIDLVAGHKQLILVMDEELGFLPMDILVAPASDGNGIGDFLIYRYQMSYAFSVTLLKEAHDLPESKAADMDLLVVSPVFNPTSNEVQTQADFRAGYEALPFSEKEAQHLAHHYGGHLLSDSVASIEYFKQFAPKSRIIHLATHAKAYIHDSQFSHIAFSPMNTVFDQDHLLHVPEIYAMNMPADMVVLSACETGLGQIKKGEGIISLGRAFTYAGAKSIISTLWSVSDQSTSEIMMSFYAYLDQGMSKDAALRQAKLDYLDSHDAHFSHPYFWAAPLAIGDMSPVQIRPNNPIWLWLSIILGLVLLLSLGWYLTRRNKIP